MIPDRRSFLALLAAPFAAVLALPFLSRIPVAQKLNTRLKNLLFAHHYGARLTRAESLEVGEGWTVKKTWNTELLTTGIKSESVLSKEKVDQLYHSCVSETSRKQAQIDAEAFYGITATEDHTTNKEKLDVLLRKELKAATDALDAAEDNDPIYGKFTMLRET